MVCIDFIRLDFWRQGLFLFWLWHFCMEWGTHLLVNHTCECIYFAFLIVRVSLWPTSSFQNVTLPFVQSPPSYTLQFLWKFERALAVLKGFFEARGPIAVDKLLTTFSSSSHDPLHSSTLVSLMACGFPQTAARRKTNIVP